MIYFDNSATGGFKPNAVITTVNTVIKYLSANPGRSGHRLSFTGAEIIYNCRKVLGDFFNADESRVIFTKNCTEALNTAIFGTLKKGGHVITTVYEHNSVLRPLYSLYNRGLISLDVVGEKGRDIVDCISEKINDQTYLVVTTLASNVTGEVLPFRKIGELCKNHGILFIADGAQACGHIPVSLKDDNINVLCLAGHKGLYGIMGSGALIFDNDTDIEPLIYGGTGTESLSVTQPVSYPERLEAGTLNLPAVSSLLEGVKYIMPNLSSFSECVYNYTSILVSQLNQIEGVRLYSQPNEVGIVSFNVGDKSSNECADLLNSKFDVAVRGGLHCAPLMHGFLGTLDSGVIRASLSANNSTGEINYFVKAINSIATDKV